MNDNVHYHSLSRLVKALRVQVCLPCFEVGFSALGLFSRILVKSPAMSRPVPKTSAMPLTP
jgi:hypothetical protein